ncbi:DPP IV N-terminal domain-containing protein [Capnocytophaga sp.]|uniref:S9 family peptidase n=1 Tax=Capnocytophaga sp. TaxID=44737 RepID=UPI0026DC2CE2|nr:DPP IV N-terminal domain-containing protein [Capnocytophaga sp.]MDO5104344.1 DPP IV N-terminal domain-containing protein [Capnocytophaga sp.]
MKKYALFLLTISNLLLWGQEKKISIQDAVFGYYADPSTEQGYKLLYPENLYGLQWIDNTHQYVYSNRSSFEIFSADGQKVRSVTGQEMVGVYPQLQYLPSLTHINEREMVFELNDGFHIYDYLNNKNLRSISVPKEAENKDYNKKRQFVAYTVENNLFVTMNGEDIAVTNNADANIVAGKAIHRSEFGIKKGTFWSPKGNFLAFYQKDETYVTDYPLVDINTVPATSKIIKYPMAGQKSERASIGIFDTKTKKTIYLDINTDDEHYLTNLSWTPDEQYVLVAEINRDQNHYWVNRYDVMTGKKVNTLFEEKNSKWVEPEHGAFFLPNKKDEFLWLSERNGFTNIYHYNLSGKLIKQLTNFKWVVQDILGFDTKGKYVFISGTGPDPRETHTYKIEINRPKKITQLTPVAGTHQTQLSHDGKFLIDAYSSVTIPNVIDIANTESNWRKNILTAKNPLNGIAVGTTELIEIKADNGTTLYGKIHKPENFNPARKYPVLVYVYGGPHAQLVTNSWLGGSYLWQPIFAENENYIVFTLDNQGSANRGFAFESIIHRQLGDTEIADQLKGIEYVKSLQYVDRSRIAVHGWSFGGFMASSLMLRHPDVFTTAVAGGAVTDWKFYEIMYGERYMDTPESNPEGYENSRVGKYLNNLKGKLLFIHGSIDDVVVPQHALSLIQESISKKLLVDFSLYPMHAHNVGGQDRANLIIRILEYIKANNH